MEYHSSTWLVVWNLNFLTFHSVGNVIIPTVTHSIIFQRGIYIRIPPTRYPPDFPTFNVAKIHQNSMSCWIFQLEPPWTNVSPAKVRLPDAEQRIQRDPQLLWRAKAKKNNKKHVSHWHCYWVNMALMLVEGGVNLMRRLEPQTEASQATFFSCFWVFVFITLSLSCWFAYFQFWFSFFCFGCHAFFVSICVCLFVWLCFFFMLVFVFVCFLFK